MTPNGVRFECQMEIYMPIFLAILSMVQGLKQMQSGNKVGGFAQMFNAGQSFGQIANDFSVADPYALPDVGVRRNFM